MMEFQPHHHTPTPAAPHKPHSPAAHHKPHQPAKPQKPAGPASHPHRQNSPLHREGRSTPRGHSSAPRGTVVTFDADYVWFGWLTEQGGGIQ